MQKSRLRRPVLLIVGGGATGATLAIHAANNPRLDCRIVVVEPHDLGKGKAYSTIDDLNILNVPAERMSLFEDRPLHFVEWLRTHHPQAESSEHWPFVSRKWFGNYIQTELQKIPKEKLQHIRKKATRIKQSGSLYEVTLEDSTKVTGEYLILATGYSDPVRTDHALLPKEVETAGSQKIGKKVLIIGSGLTAIDLWRRLSHEAVSITMISRHGLLPLPMIPAQKVPRLPKLSGMAPSQLFSVLRTLNKTKAYPWQTIADELRPQAQKIWTSWSIEERRQFVRHIKPYWEVIRHRIPASIHRQLEKDMETGRLKIFAGKVRELTENNKEVVIQASRRNQTPASDFSVNSLILATGSSVEQSLLKKSPLPGVHLCESGFGYINDTAPRLWIAGPSSKGTYWEITAIPEIRQQSHHIVSQMAQQQQEFSWLALKRVSTHPDSVGESYFQHLRHSMSFAMSLGQKTFYVMVHAFVPFLYTDKTSNDIRNLSFKMSKRREKTSA